jgi:hypothetical protein
MMDSKPVYLNCLNKDDQDGSENKIIVQGKPFAVSDMVSSSRSRYNVAPRQRATVVRRDPENGGAMIEEMYVQLSGLADKRGSGV